MNDERRDEGQTAGLWTRMLRALGVGRADRPPAARYHGRLFDYDRRLLPNRYLRSLEAGVESIEQARDQTAKSVGYPAWNLLYYTLLCSLDPEREAVVVETGTNWGLSTIILAQAMVDAGCPGIVHTVDVEPAFVEAARRNLERAGLAQRVRFEVGDSLEFLETLTASVERIDFAFLDSAHEADHVVREFEIIRPAIEAARGKVFFDNTCSGGVRDALHAIHARWGGQLVEFAHCSWYPPGNAIWQPSPRGVEPGRA